MLQKTVRVAAVHFSYSERTNKRVTQLHQNFCIATVGCTTRRRSAKSRCLLLKIAVAGAQRVGALGKIPLLAADERILSSH